jgi:hypothetical protein
MKLWWLVVSALTALAMFRFGEFSLATLSRWQNILALLGIIPAAPLVGGLVALVTYAIFRALVFDPERVLLRRNGGPFNVGDRVIVLCGAHRGRIGEIYEVTYGQGGPPHDEILRVRLGEEEAKGYKDLFRERELMRA